MATNIQYFGNSQNFIPMRINEARVSSNDQHLDTLISLVEKLAVTTCEMCYTSDHLIDVCPAFQNNLKTPINTFEDFSTISQI